MAATGCLKRWRISRPKFTRSFKPFFTPGTTEDAKAAAGHLAERLKDDYLLGPGFSVADAYLFVMLMWARKNGLSLPNPLLAYVERIKARPAVRRSLEEEKLALWAVSLS